MSNNVVQIRAGKVVASTKDLAELFGKRHDNVLRKIDSQVADYSDEFRRLNFEETSALVEMPQGGHREERIYHLTRDGFMAVAMTFNGKKAGQFREAVISQYNWMESKLQAQGQIPPTPLDPLDAIAQIGGAITRMAVALKEQESRTRTLEVATESAIVILSDSPLTTGQVEDLNKAIEKRAKYLAKAWNQTADWGQVTGKIRAALKKKFLPSIPASQCTWKNICQGDYEAALEFVVSIPVRSNGRIRVSK